MAKVGTLTFDTALDTKQLEKDIKGAEKALEEFDNKNEKLKNQKIKLKVDTDEAIRKINELEKKSEYLGKKEDILKQKLGTAIDNKNSIAEQQISLQLDQIDAQTEKIISEQARLNDEIKKNANEWDEINDKLIYNSKAQGHIKDNISDMKEELTQAVQEQSKLTEETRKTQQVKNQDDSSKGFGDWLKKITKIGLGLVGLRTGMSLLRNMVSTLAGQNDKIAIQINTMKSALANVFAPVVEFIIRLFKTLVYYIGYIYKAWTGINIFSKETEKNVNKTKKGLGGANKEATKLKRTLAGFDEMNILNKDGSTSVGGGGGGIDKQIDMSIFDDIAKMEVPGWVQWIADNKDGILNALKYIGIAIGTIWATIKGISIIEKLFKLKGLLEGMSNLQVFGLVAGLAITLVGIVQTIEVLTDDTSTWIDLLNSLSTVIIGVGIALVALNASNPVGWIVLAIGAVGKFVSWLGDLAGETKTAAKAQKDLNDATRKYQNQLEPLMSAYDNMDQAEKQLVETGKKYKLSRDDAYWQGLKIYEQMTKEGKKYDDLDDKEKDLVKTIINYTSAQNRLGDEMQKNQDNLDDILLKEIEYEKQLAFNSRNFDTYIEKLTEGYERGLVDANHYYNEIYLHIRRLDEQSRQTFYDNLPDDVKEGVKKMSYEIKNNKLPGLTVKVGAKLDTTSVGRTLKDLANKFGVVKLAAGTYAKGGIVGYAKGGVVNLPKLAPGGLINRPGPGVAIGGERGTEGVVPLTDSQQMARLGEAIGRYVNIRAEIPVNIGNRQVAREIRNINAEESFAFNG